MEKEKSLPQQGKFDEAEQQLKTLQNFGDQIGSGRRTENVKSEAKEYLERLK